MVNYSLAMSQIIKNGDISGEGLLDDDEKRVFTEMASKLGKWNDNPELNQILNSAIA